LKSAQIVVIRIKCCFSLVGLRHTKFCVKVLEMCAQFFYQFCTPFGQILLEFCVFVAELRASYGSVIPGVVLSHSVYRFTAFV